MLAIDFSVRPEQNTNFSQIDTHAVIKTLILILEMAIFWSTVKTILINEVTQVFYATILSKTDIFSYYPSMRR